VGRWVDDHFVDPQAQLPDTNAGLLIESPVSCYEELVTQSGCVAIDLLASFGSFPLWASMVLKKRAISFESVKWFVLSKGKFDHGWNIKC
jgi:hypothetical protein